MWLQDLFLKDQHPQLSMGSHLACSQMKQLVVDNPQEGLGSHLVKYLVKDDQERRKRPLGISGDKLAVAEDPLMTPLEAMIQMNPHLMMAYPEGEAMVEEAAAVAAMILQDQTTLIVLTPEIHNCATLSTRFGQRFPAIGNLLLLYRR